MPDGGWGGLPPIEDETKNWPLDLAAEILGMPEKDLRALVRILGVQPTGTVKTATYRRSGRHPRAYDAAKLTRIYEAVRRLGLEL